MRVHELAKKLKITSKELLAELKKQGVKAKTHMELLDSKVVGGFLKKHPSSKTTQTKIDPKKIAVTHLAPDSCFIPVPKEKCEAVLVK